MADHETTDPVVRVRRDLRRIAELCGDLVNRVSAHGLGVPVPRRPGFVGPMPEAKRRVRVSGSRLLTQAVHDGNNAMMPGGNAMVALAAVTSAETWGYKLDTAEQNAEAKSWRTGEPATPVEVYDDDDWEPPLQTLRYWSDRWRVVHGMEYDQAPTVDSEANFLRWVAEWAYDDDPTMFVRFADDVAKARTRVENVLHDGQRSERGVPCMYDECRGARLVRKLVPGRDEDGNKVWYHSKWHCPKCHRGWDEDEYARMKTAAAEAAKIEDVPIVAGGIKDGADDTLEVVDYETWCTVEYAAKRTGRPAATIRVWAHRGRIPSACLLAGQRRGFVRLEDVEREHALAERRAEAIRAGKRRRGRATCVR